MQQTIFICMVFQHYASLPCPESKSIKKQVHTNGWRGCQHQAVVWDTTFDAKLLNRYPSVKKALSQKVTIQNVIESKDHLEINYFLTYESDGSVLKMQSANFKSTGIDTLIIRL